GNSWDVDAPQGTNRFPRVPVRFAQVSALANDSSDADDFGFDGAHGGSSDHESAAGRPGSVLRFHPGRCPSKRCGTSGEPFTCRALLCTAGSCGNARRSMRTVFRKALPHLGSGSTLERSSGSRLNRTYRMAINKSTKNVRRNVNRMLVLANHL